MGDEKTEAQERYWTARNAEDYFRANFSEKIKAMLASSPPESRSELLNIMVTSLSNTNGYITGIQVSAMAVDKCPNCKHSETYTLFSFFLGRFPGCCAYLVSHNSYVWYTWRHKGFGTLMQEMKAAFAKITNHGRMVCTVINTNQEEIGLLKKTGWKAVDEGVNPKTNNRVIMFVKKL